MRYTLHTIHTLHTLHTLSKRLRALARDERAAAVLEYAIVLGVIIAAISIAVTPLGNTISTAVTDIAAKIPGLVANVGST